jgi:hypothetical protein
MMCVQTYSLPGTGGSIPLRFEVPSSDVLCDSIPGLGGGGSGQTFRQHSTNQTSAHPTPPLPQLSARTSLSARNSSHDKSIESARDNRSLESSRHSLARPPFLIQLENHLERELARLKLQYNYQSNQYQSDDESDDDDERDETESRKQMALASNTARLQVSFFLLQIVSAKYMFIHI